MHGYKDSVAFVWAIFHIGYIIFLIKLGTPHSVIVYKLSFSLL